MQARGRGPLLARLGGRRDRAVQASSTSSSELSQLNVQTCGRAAQTDLTALMTSYTLTSDTTRLGLHRRMPAPQRERAARPG
jgi:hypothetical protein